LAFLPVFFVCLARSGCLVFFAMASLLNFHEKFAADDRHYERKRDKALFLIAYRHGIRGSEVGILRREDLDLKRMQITLSRLKGDGR
jgi:integrase